MQIEIYTRQKALRDLAIGGAQRAVTGPAPRCMPSAWGREKVPMSIENLELLTADSGGYVEDINDPAEISAAVARVFDELQSQYVLAFESSRTNGKYHEISVTHQNRDLHVRARAGYTAAELRSGK